MFEVELERDIPVVFIIVKTNSACYGHVNTLIKSKKHNLSTIEQTKKGLSAFDDKRCVSKGSTDTLPWGHFKIGIERNNFIKHLRNLSTLHM
jgi:hypothetical protein